LRVLTADALSPSSVLKQIQNIKATWQNPPSSWPRNGARTARCGTWARLIVADTKSTFWYPECDVSSRMTALR